MPPPTPLAIATSSLQRLVKEETSYHKELAAQHTRLQKLEAQPMEERDENAGFSIEQEKKAIEETKAVFPPLRTRIEDALRRLEDLVEGAATEGGGKEGELEKAREVVGLAREAVEGEGEK